MRIIFLFLINILCGIFWFLKFKIVRGFKSFYCADSETNYSDGDCACNQQCYFCHTTTNTCLGLKMYDKKTNKWYRINKKIE